MKTLIFDIETSLMEVYTHYIGQKVSLNFNQIKKHTKVICIGYKWLGEKKAQVLTWDKNQDDKQMLTEFNEIAKQADALVAHNGANFDVKHIRAAIALRGLPITWAETPVIDTLRDYRRMFRFNSNKLDAIASHLGLARKSPMSMQDWIDINNDVPGALEKMAKYCKQDVEVLEQVYLRLKPYVTPSASESRLVTAKLDKTMPAKCPSCGHKHLIKYGMYTYKGLNLQKYLCKSCYTVTKSEAANA